jgi:hypothetical protein
MPLPKVIVGACVLVGVALPVLIAADLPTANPKKAPSSTGDEAAIKEADVAQKTVQEKEEKLVKLLHEIAEATNDIQPGDLAKENRALDSFKKIIPALRDKAAWLLNKQQDFGQSMQLYQAALERMPGAFLKAGEVYAKYAAAEEDLFFKEQYLDMSARSKKLAATMAVRAKEVKGTEAEIGQKLRFIERSVVFLTRLEGFVSIYDPASGKTPEIQTYLKHLDSYISQFNLTIASFRQLSDKIQGSPARQ